MGAERTLKSPPLNFFLDQNETLHNRLHYIHDIWPSGRRGEEKRLAPDS